MMVLSCYFIVKNGFYGQSVLLDPLSRTLHPELTSLVHVFFGKMFSLPTAVHERKDDCTMLCWDYKGCSRV